MTSFSMLLIICTRLLMLVIAMTEAWRSCSDPALMKNKILCSCNLSSITANTFSFGIHNPLSINEKRRMLITSTWAPNITWGVCVYTETGYLLKQDTVSPQPPYTCLSGNLTLPIDLIVRRGHTDPSSFGRLRLVYYAWHQALIKHENNHLCYSSFSQEATAIVHFTPSNENIHLSVKPKNTVTQGSTVTLLCHTSDGYPHVRSYHWLKDNTANNGSSFRRLEGVNFERENTFIIEYATISDIGTYKCVAENYPFGMLHETVSEEAIYLSVI